MAGALQTAQPQGTQDQNASCDSCGQSGHRNKDCPPTARTTTEETLGARSYLQRESLESRLILKGPADATGLEGPGVLTVAPLTQLFMGTPKPHVTLEI